MSQGCSCSKWCNNQFKRQFGRKKLGRESEGKKTLESDIENQADVPDSGASQVLENRDQIEQFVIVRIREPTADRHRVLGVENVRSRRVVDDYCVLEVAPNLGQVLYVVALMVIATLAEQPVVNNLVDVQLIEEGVTILLIRLARHLLSASWRSAYLGHRRCEDNNLVELANPLHELVNAWPLDDIDIMVVALDFYRYREVGLVKDLGQSAFQRSLDMRRWLTLNELWTNVSSRSRTRHLRPLCSGACGGKRNRCG